MRNPLLLVGLTLALMSPSAAQTTPCQSIQCAAHSHCVTREPWDTTSPAAFCLCDTGYQKVGALCQVVLNTAPACGPCDRNAVCTPNVAGAPACVCNPGYIGNGKVCCPSGSILTEGKCVTPPPRYTCPCADHGRCTSAANEPLRCTCDSGYAFIDGKCRPAPPSCRPACDANATCVPSNFSPGTCRCKQGYQGDGYTCTANRH